MHVRTTTSHKNGKTYRYTQLVQSVRDKNGRSTTKVHKHLGVLTEPVIQALKIAVKAGGNNERVFLESEVAKLLHGQDVANRRFLDLAVLIDCWNQWGLDSLLHDLAPNSASLLKVVLPLVLQRCCAPGSKLSATRWVPKTALPELLGFQPNTFNNTCIHRGPEVVHKITPALQDRLASAYNNSARFGALFMDVTDTYFEGIGCPLAEQTRTKTEMPNKRCIAIVMLCNELGYPIRWQVLGGKTKDWTAMEGLLRQIEDAPWLRKTPIVFDRAMGNQSTVAKLKQSGLWFLTAAHRTAIESYTADIPYQPFVNIEVEGTDELYERDIERAAQTARDAGFEEIHSRLFTIDLRVASPPQPSAKCVPRDRHRGRPNQVAKHLGLGEQLRQRMQDDPTLTKTALANEFAVSHSRVRMSFELLQLCPEVRQIILNKGDLFTVPEEAIRTLFEQEAHAQVAGLEALHQETKERTKTNRKASTNSEKSLGQLRLVAYFNPQLFVDIRRRTEGHCRLIQQRVDEFNEELASAKRSRKRDPTYRKFAKEIERLHYLDAFDIQLEPITITSRNGKNIKSFRGSITLKPKVWARRRKYDGFVLLLGHPDLPQTATQLVGYYRGKDVVEKDFQTIKSFEKLRPIYHYTDPKVLAHVTICMIALLLLRTLSGRLREAGAPWTDGAALEILADCYLNERDADVGINISHTTRLTPEQEEILRELNLERLADPVFIRSILTPRTE